MGIRLREDVFFSDPESRIREYCEIEVYEGYDDRHAENNVITSNDIEAANKLYAMINKHSKTEGSRIQGLSGKISPILAEIPHDLIHTYSDEEWSNLIPKVERLLEKMTSIHGVGIEKVMKIIYLKRPEFFPPLDNQVIQFLTKKRPSSSARDISLALQSLDASRELIRTQIDEFTELQSSLQDLPIPLTIARLFDILCWTTYKWDIMRRRNAPNGTASKSLIEIKKPKKAKPAKKRPTTHKRKPMIQINSSATQDIIVDFFDAQSKRAKYGIRGEKPLAVLAVLRYLIDTKQIGIKFLELLDYPYYEKYRKTFISEAERYGNLADAANSWMVITGVNRELQEEIEVNGRVNQAVAGLITVEIEAVYQKLLQKYEKNPLT
jgi:hypothetical protein